MRTCDKCGEEMNVVNLYVGGRGYLPHEVCPTGCEDSTRRLPTDWQMIEAAEDEAFRRANHEPANPGDWARAMKVKGAIAAVLAVILVLVK
jgi:hypothetical protein